MRGSGSHEAGAFEKAQQQRHRPGGYSTTSDGAVAIGPDGWLFLIGGSNKVLAFLRQLEEDRRAQIGRWTRLILDRHARLSRARTRYLHVAVPDKLTIYGDRIGVHIANGPNAQLHRALHPQASELLLDLTPPFRDNGEDLFLKTGTHWTQPGCYIAYRLVCEKLGVDPVRTSGAAGTSTSKPTATSAASCCRPSRSGRGFTE